MTLEQELREQAVTLGELRNREPPVGQQLAAEHQKSVEHGLAVHAAVVADRDRLIIELRDVGDQLARAKMQIAELESTRNTIESRINGCIAQRDEAVAKTGELRGVINSLAAVLVRYHDKSG